jgi:hypothetical protein
MTRRLLELCLLAYPRVSRKRDAEFLRDLALDLGGTHGFARQAMSLLLGGLKERIEGYRRRGAAIACLAFIALAVAASGHEIEGYACAPAESSLRFSSAGGCAEMKRLVAAKKREGWDCTSRRRSGAGRDWPTWECTRGSTAVAWLPL